MQEMKVFFSHAHQDKVLADKTRELLVVASGGMIKPYIASALDGLKPGDVLWDNIHDELDTSEKVITIITPVSMSRPWLLYESGYVAGKRGSQIVPLLFGINHSDLPLPLSAYKCYNADKQEEIFEFLFQMVSFVLPQPHAKSIELVAKQFIEDIGPLMTKYSIPKVQQDVRYLDKTRVSEILNQRLADPSVKNVDIFTYTNEVEGGAISHYKIKGDKHIRIYKRSIVADLAEQQAVNISRLIKGTKLRRWNKAYRSREVTERLVQETGDSTSIKLEQFFYDQAPTRRGFLVDNCEAVVSHYICNTDVLSCDGSIYKGMTDESALWITNNSEVGKSIIGELIQFIKILNRHSRTWTEEQQLMDGSSHKRIQSSFTPCLSPLAVFLDVDGVLYDSLPMYVQTWKEAFSTIHIDITEEEVYLFEGRSGTSTITQKCKSEFGRLPTDEELDKVLQIKREAMEALGRPKVMSGAYELLQAIHNSGLPMFIVSGSNKASVTSQ